MEHKEPSSINISNFFSDMSDVFILVILIKDATSNSGYIVSNIRIISE